MKIVNSPPRKDTSPRYRRHSHVHFSLPFPHPGALPHPKSQPWGGLCFRLASNAVNSPELIVGVSVGTFFSAWLLLSLWGWSLGGVNFPGRAAGIKLPTLETWRRIPLSWLLAAPPLTVPVTPGTSRPP